jgi:hypothetical protein
MYPQKRSSGLPFAENTALKEPLSCTVVMSFGCNVMIYGWICNSTRPKWKA